MIIREKEGSYCCGSDDDNNDDASGNRCPFSAFPRCCLFENVVVVAMDDLALSLAQYFSLDRTSRTKLLKFLQSFDRLITPLS
jgi:hypothetical protein